MYYIFNGSLKNTIYQALQSVKGDGFWDMKPHQKCVEITQIPTSNTDDTPIRDYRTVFILETLFAPQDAQLEAQAKALADYWTSEAINAHGFLAITDVQTQGKTKQELDILLDV